MTRVHLLFLLSERLFGVELTGAVEIVPWRQGRRVPLSYSYVEGLIDYRGAVYPIMNLKQRLGLGRQGPIGFTAEEQQQPVKDQSIILLEENGNRFGITVDRVVKMINIGETATPNKMPGLDVKYVKGVASDDNQEVILLDFERLLFHGS